MESYETPAFATVAIPTQTPREEYTAAERRAELYRIITDLGHPSLINQTEMAQRYGVSQPMISKDLDVLAEHVANSLDDRHELEIDSVFRRSIRGLLEDEEWRKAAQTASDYADWMTERSDIEDLREEIDLLKQATEFDS